MTAVLLCATETDARLLLPWACRFAESSQFALEVIVCQERPGGTEWSSREPLNRPHPLPLCDGQEMSPSSGGEEASGNRVDIPVRQLKAADVEAALFADAPPWRLLILPLEASKRGGRSPWPRRVFQSAACECVLLQTAAEDPPLEGRVLVPVAASKNAEAALERAAALVGELSRVTAAYVTPSYIDASDRVGERILEAQLRRTLGGRSGEIQTQVIVDEDVVRGVAQGLPADTALLVVGASRDRTIRRFVAALAEKQARVPLAVVRAALPVGTRLQRVCERLLERCVPQLDREARVELVRRVQQASEWNFDFIALIGLSTAIAALGLVQGQAAVIIGAMLVAPLMTPLIGAGLAVVQGNSRLLASTLFSVGFGFLLALIVGVLVGWVTPLKGDAFTSEIIGRTTPGLTDLAVAVVGGVAAAYAMGRPNLSSALPGVAIAAALVPPIAAAGIAASHGEWQLALGALLLFLTNIVAIVPRNRHKFVVHGDSRRPRTWHEAIVDTVGARSVVVARRCGRLRNLGLDQSESGECPGSPRGKSRSPTPSSIAFRPLHRSRGRGSIHVTRCLGIPHGRGGPHLARIETGGPGAPRQRPGPRAVGGAARGELRLTRVMPVVTRDRRFGRFLRPAFWGSTDAPRTGQNGSGGWRGIVPA